MFAMKVRGDAGLVIGKMTKEIDPAMARAVFTSAQFASGKLREVCNAVFPGGTGGLGRSFAPPVFVASSKGVAAGALSDLPQADVLDRGTDAALGGPIRAKPPRKYLAQPLTAKAKNMWPREWPQGKLVFIISKKGNKLLALINGKDIKPQYLLKPELTIRGRNYIDMAVVAIEKDVEDTAVEEMEVGFDDVPGVEKT